MKKNVVVLLIIVLCTAFTFAGCSEDGSSVPTAQASQTASAASDNSASQASASSAPSAAADNSQFSADTSSAGTESSTQATESDTSTAMASYNVSDYEDRIVDLANRMDNAQMSDYKSLKKEARQISDEMDRTEDLAEIDYYNGKISNYDYIQVERELEVLEEMLDHAEDSMEIRLGIDD